MQGKAEQHPSVVNVAESSIARESDLALPILAGLEVGVASTKAFTCQLTVLLLLALKAAHDRGRIDEAGLPTICATCASCPALMSQALRDADEGRAQAARLSHARDVLFWGAGRCIRWRWKAR